VIVHSQYLSRYNQHPKQWCTPVLAEKPEEAQVGRLEVAFPAPLEGAQVGRLEVAFPAQLEGAQVGRLEALEGAQVGRLEGAFPAPLEGAQVGRLEGASAAGQEGARVGKLEVEPELEPGATQVARQEQEGQEKSVVEVVRKCTVLCLGTFLRLEGWLPHLFQQRTPRRCRC
jgi:hypothetical protein